MRRWANQKVSTSKQALTLFTLPGEEYRMLTLMERLLVQEPPLSLVRLGGGRMSHTSR